MQPLRKEFTIEHRKFCRSLRFDYAYRKVRDSQRSKSYRWEDWARNSDETRQHHFESKRQAKSYARLAAKVGLAHMAKLRGMSEQEAAAIWKGFRVYMTTEQERSCCGSLAGVYFAKWGWTDWIICHEVAHWLDHHDAHYQKESRAGHGPKWRGWYLWLLQEIGGEHKQGYDLETLKAGLALHGMRAIMPS